MEEPLIQPVIFFKPGQCPRCSGMLMVLDNETSCMLLDEEGYPIREDTKITIKGVCQSCGSVFPMMRYGMGYRHESESFLLFERFRLMNERKRDINNLTSNPFVNEENKDT